MPSRTSTPSNHRGQIYLSRILLPPDSPRPASASERNSLASGFSSSFDAVSPNRRRESTSRGLQPVSLFNFQSPVCSPASKYNQYASNHTRLTAQSRLMDAVNPASMMERALRILESKKRPFRMQADEIENLPVSPQGIAKRRCVGQQNNSYVLPDVACLGVDGSHELFKCTSLAEMQANPVTDSHETTINDETASDSQHSIRIAMPRPKAICRRSPLKLSTCILPNRVSCLPSAVLEVLAFGSRKRKASPPRTSAVKSETLDELLNTSDSVAVTSTSEPSAKRITKEAPTQTESSVNEPGSSFTACMTSDASEARPVLRHVSSVSQFIAGLEARARANALTRSKTHLAKSKTACTGFEVSSLEARHDRIRKLFATLSSAPEIPAPNSVSSENIIKQSPSVPTSFQSVSIDKAPISLPSVTHGSKVGDLPSTNLAFDKGFSASSNAPATTTDSSIVFSTSTCSMTSMPTGTTVSFSSLVPKTIESAVNDPPLSSTVTSTGASVPIFSFISAPSAVSTKEAVKPVFSITSQVTSTAGTAPFNFSSTIPSLSSPTVVPFTFEATNNSAAKNVSLGQSTSSLMVPNSAVNKPKTQSTGSLFSTGSVPVITTTELSGTSIFSTNVKTSDTPATNNSFTSPAQTPQPFTFRFGSISTAASSVSNSKSSSKFQFGATSSSKMGATTTSSGPGFQLASSKSSPVIFTSLPSSTSPAPVLGGTLNGLSTVSPFPLSNPPLSSGTLLFSTASTSAPTFTITQPICSQLPFTSTSISSASIFASNNLSAVPPVLSTSITNSDASVCTLPSLPNKPFALTMPSSSVTQNTPGIITNPSLFSSIVTSAVAPPPVFSFFSTPSAAVTTQSTKPVFCAENSQITNSTGTALFNFNSTTGSSSTAGTSFTFSVANNPNVSVANQVFPSQSSLVGSNSSFITGSETKAEPTGGLFLSGSLPAITSPGFVGASLFSSNATVSSAPVANGLFSSSTTSSQPIGFKFGSTSTAFISDSKPSGGFQFGAVTPATSSSTMTTNSSGGAPFLFTSAKSSPALFPSLPLPTSLTPVFGGLSNSSSIGSSCSNFTPPLNSGVFSTTAPSFGTIFSPEFVAAPINESLKRKASSAFALTPVSQPPQVGTESLLPKKASTFGSVGFNFGASAAKQVTSGLATATITPTLTTNGFNFSANSFGSPALGTGFVFGQNTAPSALGVQSGTVALPQNPFNAPPVAPNAAASFQRRRQMRLKGRR